MKNNQEKYAFDLHSRLVERFGGVPPNSDVTVSGGGVHWQCFVRGGQRSCLTHCFDNPFLGRRGPEFLTNFNDQEEEIASGRTSSPNDTVEAIWHWLDGDSLPLLYDRFKFVDQQKRELVCIRESVLQHFPDLNATAPSELEYHGSGQYSLWFRSETRSAHIDYYSDKLDARFHWDQCELFSVAVDDWSLLSSVLKRWLCDNAPPSAMRQEFPSLKIGELADYYENGRPVEGEFIQSWKEIEQFYSSEPFPLRDRVLGFIAQLRRAGYDRKFRAGQSMWTFILSRSRRHRLRNDQPYVQFDFQFPEGTMDVLSKTQAEERTAGIAIALSSQVEEALARLLNQPIN